MTYQEKIEALSGAMYDTVASNGETTIIPISVR